jgi:hypothetical protein
LGFLFDSEKEIIRDKYRSLEMEEKKIPEGYYSRRGYWRRRWLDGRKVYVRPTIVRDGHRRTRKLEHGEYQRFKGSAQIRSQIKMFGANFRETSLGRYGYKNLRSKSTRQRHSALQRANSGLGIETVKDRLEKTIGAIRKKMKRYLYNQRKELDKKKENGKIRTPTELYKEKARINEGLFRQGQLLSIIKSDLEYINGKLNQK